MVAPTNVRFPASVDSELSGYAKQHRRPKSAVVVVAVSEWLDSQAHPGIVFRTAVTGERLAALEGGPEVWTVAESWLQHEAGPERTDAVSDALGLSSSQVERALGYWADHREAIDGYLQRHRAAQDDALASWERRQVLGSLTAADH